jgi:acyl-CoA oxidase
MARLFVRGRDYGPHAFIVQLRDLKTHKALPGVELGDIGPKFGEVLRRLCLCTVSQRLL